MKLKLILLFTCLTFFVIKSIATGQPNNPAVITLDAKTLANNKSKVNANDAALMPAYKQLLKDADKALKFGPVSVMEKKHLPPSGDKHDYMSLAPYHWPDPNKPDGLPYMRKDGQTNPEVKEYKDKEYLPQICEHIYKLSLAYYFSGESQYAQHAAKLIDVWFLDASTKMNPNMNYAQAIKGVNTGRGAGMIDARHLMKVIDAVGLIENSKYWTATNNKEMKQWFADFLQWMQTSPNGLDELDAPNNHGIWYDALRLSIALFTGQKAHAQKIVLNAQNRLDKQMDEAGDFPKEMERTTSLHYTVFAMEAFFKVAQMAEKIDIDFWGYTSPSGKSLKKGFDKLLPYISEEKTWTGQQIKHFDFEEGYPLLASGYAKLNCKNCKEYIKKSADEKAPRLLINLIY